MSDLIHIRTVNQALSMIGRASINDIEERGAAETVKLHYLPLLKFLQTKYHWAHCKKKADITAEVATSTLPGFTYAHKVPTDLIHPYTVQPEDTPDNSNWLNNTFTSDSYNTINSLHKRENGVYVAPTKWELAEGKIHTNFENIQLFYYGFFTDMQRTPEHFKQGFIGQLASRICFPITKDVKLSQQISDVAEKMWMQCTDIENYPVLTEYHEGSSFDDARD